MRQNKTKYYIGVFEDGKCIERIGGSFPIQNDFIMDFMNAYVGGLDREYQASKERRGVKDNSHICFDVDELNK